MCQLHTHKYIDTHTHQVIRLLRTREAFITQIEDFEFSAQEKNRLFGSSVRLLEEERFRKTCYPALRGQDALVMAALKNFRREFNYELEYPDGVVAREEVKRSIEVRPGNPEVQGLLGLGGDEDDKKNKRY
jgi:hypothetical protein